MAMETTTQSFDRILQSCLELFLKKNQDYGTSWRVLRPSSVTDQILIKATRIRSVDEKGIQKVDDPLHLEFYGLINYSVMALIQLTHKDLDEKLSIDMLKSYYDDQINQVRSLLFDKNHDYGEVWRMMRISSIIDIILMKIHRIISIEENEGKTVVSEGIDANYHDIINYSVFSIIKLKEKKADDII